LHHHEAFKLLNTELLKWIVVSTLSIQAFAIAANMISIKAILRRFTVLALKVEVNSHKNDK